MSDPVITLNIPQSKLEYFKSTVNNHISLIHKLGISDLIKKDLIKDIHILKTIVEPKGGKNGS